MRIFRFMTFITKRYGKPLRTMFHKVCGFIREHDGSKFLVLFGPEKLYGVFHSSRYLITLKFFLVKMQTFKLIQMMIYP